MAPGSPTSDARPSSETGTREPVISWNTDTHEFRVDEGPPAAPRSVAGTLLELWRQAVRPTRSR